MTAKEAHWILTMIKDRDARTDAERDAIDTALTALSAHGDLISRQALCEYALNQKDKSVTPNDIMRFPSAQPELIEQGAYVRGFEQGRTQGMIDVQGEPMSVIKAEWTNADALDLQPTCNQLATDCISKQSAIDDLHTKDPSMIWDTADVEVWVNALPSAQPDIIVCADCKHWICHDRRCGFWNHGVKPLDWCCHAERRTDEAD